MSFWIHKDRCLTVFFLRKTDLTPGDFRLYDIKLANMSQAARKQC